jgi:hypothetical protein
MRACRLGQLAELVDTAGEHQPDSSVDRILVRCRRPHQRGRHRRTKLVAGAAERVVGRQQVEPLGHPHLRDNRTLGQTIREIANARTPNDHS